MRSVVLECAAVAFVLVFEAVREIVGAALALLDSRVQAARRRYLEARAGQ